VSAPDSSRSSIRPPGGFFGPGRLIRYGITGLASAGAHVGVLTLLVELAGVRPVVASALWFVVSVLVSYALQHRWVFVSTVPNRRAFPRFLVVTGVGFALNTSIMWIGTEILEVNYLLTQAVALVAIPVSNYTLNSYWTFRS
jgi:putative flippase GtrA